MAQPRAVESRATDLARQHTLVVTTFDRPVYLARVLSIIAAGGSIGSVVIADASHEEHRASNRALVDKLLAGSRLLRVELPPSTSVIGLYEAAIRAVDTPYLTFCADDDLIHPAYVADAVRFLEDHPDHAACAGRSFSFGPAEESGVRIYASGTRAREEEDPRDRFLALLRSYWPVEFSTRRTADANDALLTLDAFRLCEALGEPLHGAAHVLTGKVAVIERPGVLRGWHEQNNANRSFHRRQLFFDGSFSEAFELLVRHVAARVGSSPAEADPSLRLDLGDALLRHFACHPRYFQGDVAGGSLRDGAPTVDQFGLARASREIAEAIHRDLLGDRYEPSRLSGPGPLGFDEDRVSTTVIHLSPDRRAYTLCDHATRQPPTESAPDGAREAVERNARSWARTIVEPDFSGRYGALRASHIGLLPDGVREDHAERCFDALALRVLGADLHGLQGFEVDDPADVIARTGVDELRSPFWTELVELATVALTFPHPRHFPGQGAPESQAATPA